MVAHVFVLEVLEQLELTVCALGEHRSAEGLHDLLDGDILAGKLISGGTVEGTLSQLLSVIEGSLGSEGEDGRKRNAPDEAKSSHANRLEIRVPANRKESVKAVGRIVRVQPLPRGDLECGAKDLGADELGHGEGLSGAGGGFREGELQDASLFS